jgi:SNF2 family DNA or RNA helicase
MFTVEGINRKGKRRLYADLNILHELADEFSLSIIDEIHYSKNHTSLRFSIAAALTDSCKYALGLTGTPYGRNPYDMWAQSFLVDRGKTLGHNYYFFEQAFGVKKYHHFKGEEWVFDKKKFKILDHKMSQLAVVYNRKDYVDEVVFAGTVDLRMHGDQLEAYGDVIMHMLKINETDHVNLGATFQKLRQVASGYMSYRLNDEDHIVEFQSNPKLEWLEEFITEAPPDVQFVIFHEFRHTSKMICDMLTKRKVPHSRLYGSTTDKSTPVKDFQQGRSRVLVANSNSGGIAIDLPMADYMLFFESPCSPIVRKQAEARPMSRGEKPLMIDDIVCAAVERRVLACIAEGRSLMASLGRERRKFAEK